MESKTTTKDFEAFKKYCLEYQEILGITNYNIYFDHKQLKDKFVQTRINYQGHVAMVSFSKKWPDRLVTEGELRKTALHEMVHILIISVSFLGACRYITESEIEEADEELTVKLEYLLTKLLYGKKV